MAGGCELWQYGESVSIPGVLGRMDYEMDYVMLGGVSMDSHGVAGSFRHVLGG